MTLAYAMIGGGPGAMIGEAHRMTAKAAGWTLVAGAFSSDPQKSRQQAEASGLSPDMGYGDWRALIADAGRLGLDAIIVVTPNHLHAEPVIAALETGLHVVCDKPLARDTSETAAIAAAAAHARGRVFVTYTYAGFEAVRHAAKLVSEGAIGTLRLVQASYFQDWLATKLEDTGLGLAAWRMDPARSGPAGATADIGTHLWHLCSLVTGTLPEAISADLSAQVPGRKLDDTGLIRVRYANGARGQLAVTQAAICAPGGLDLQVMGDKGGLSWSIAQPFDLRLLKPGDKTETLTFPDTSAFAALKGPPPGYLGAFQRIYADIADAIVGGPAHPPGLADGLAGVAFVEAAVRSSAADGAWVRP